IPSFSNSPWIRGAPQRQFSAAIRESNLERLDRCVVFQDVVASAAIVVRETQPTFTKLTSQKPVLFDHVRNFLPLPAVQPAGQHTEHQGQRRGVDHEPELTSWMARRMSADLWNTTGCRSRIGGRGMPEFYVRSVRVLAGGGSGK